MRSCTLSEAYCTGVFHRLMACLYSHLSKHVGGTECLNDQVKQQSTLLSISKYNDYSWGLDNLKE